MTAPKELPKNIQSLVYLIDDCKMIDSVQLANALKISHEEILNLIKDFSAEQEKSFIPIEWVSKNIKLISYHIKMDGLLTILNFMKIDHDNGSRCSITTPQTL